MIGMTSFAHRSRRRSSLLAVLVAAGLVTAAACGSDDDGGGTASDDSSGSTDGGGGGGAGDNRIVVAALAEPHSMDPHLTDDEPQMVVTHRLYEQLVTFDAEGELQPMLAESLPENVDPTTWRVHLRPDVTFHDGSPMNADAVVYTIERILDPATAAYPQLVQTYAGATKVDDLTVDITTPEPDPLLPTKLFALRIIPTGDDMQDIPDDVIGTGPYMLESFDQATGAVLRRNPDYWGEPASIEEIEIRWIPEPATRLLALRNGEVDLLINLDPGDADEAPKIEVSPEGVSFQMIRLNTGSPSKPFLQDARVREALNLAIDREVITQDLYDGYADPANCQPAPPQAFGTNPDLEAPDYDPDRARELIEEAGATGETINLSWQNRTTIGRDLAQLVADMWRQVGFEVELELMADDPWLEGLLRIEPDTALDAVNIPSDNNFNDVARQVGDYYASTGGVSTYDNPEIDERISEAAATFDPASREEQYQSILADVCEDYPLVYLYFERALYGMSERLEYTPRSDIFSRLYYDEMTLADG